MSYVIPLKEAPGWVQDSVNSYARGENVRPLVHVDVREKVSVSGSEGELHVYHNEITGETKAVRGGYNEDIISDMPIQQAIAGGIEVPLRQGQSYLKIGHYYEGGTKYYVELFVSPLDAPHVLPPVGVELTEDEKILLQCTIGLKSSYAGIRDLRGYEAKQKGMRESPDEVRASLKVKGLMNNKNALTLEGRNAAMQLRGYAENPRQMPGRNYCLVCQQDTVFDNSLDEDCNRCSNCGALPYTEVTDIVMDHRAELAGRHEQNPRSVSDIIRTINERIGNCKYYLDMFGKRKLGDRYCIDSAWREWIIANALNANALTPEEQSTLDTRISALRQRIIDLENKLLGTENVARYHR
jgi:hypothetical protein